MTKRIICTECPKGCPIEINVEAGIVRKLEGNACPKGETYARAEVEHPTRVLTSSIMTRGLSVKMLPVKTDRPVPKERIEEIMSVLRSKVIGRPVHVGDIVIEEICGLNANIVATRTVWK